MKLVFNIGKYLLCIWLMILMLVGVWVWCIAVAGMLTIAWGLTVVLMSALYAYGTIRLVSWLWPLKYEDWRD